jgi:transposase
MATPLVPDELWEIIEPLLPREKPKPKGGRPRVPDRACLSGIIFVLKSGIQWEMLPQEMNCGSGITCWRRLRDWIRAGVWKKLQHELLNRLRDADRIDWSRAAMDASPVPAKKGVLRLARHRLIAANRVQSGTWSRTGRASRSRS